MSDDKLLMSFDPNTIQHLGIKMYSNLPAAIAELVANSYDADAHKVEIDLIDTKGNRSLTVKDNGHGMTFEEVNDCFLRIGRNRRIEKASCSPEGRVATGKKGLGKLALFGIGNEIKVVTKKKNLHEKISFSLKWQDILNCKDKVYEPLFTREEDNSEGGYTEITILDLKRKTAFDHKGLTQALAKMFNLFDSTFEVIVYHNDQDGIKLNNELKYSGIESQFAWSYPADFTNLDSIYQHRQEIKGKIISTEKPLQPHMRGITLFANGRLVNLPEFFGRPESSHFYSYTTGWLDIDFIDIDNNVGDDDLISTNRQSLDWEKDETILLRSFLQEVLAYVQRDWRKKRKETNKRNTPVTAGIDREKWLSSIPKEKADIISAALENIADPDSKDEPIAILEKAIHDIVPEYATLHWRFLNSNITQSPSVERLYQQGNFFQAASEAVKSYIAKVRKISGSTEQSDNTMMMKVFGSDESSAISLTQRSDGIERDIEQGQKYYSGGVVTGFKNPVASHATEDELKQRGLFSEKDCLDILSLLSHLFDRLEKRVSPK
ncbi:MAG: TIGR02391 family protein [Kiritimatiellae bacterium]|nr:TIGR02391 family protein [Kiritimatiellia bacterium]